MHARFENDEGVAVEEDGRYVRRGDIVSCTTAVCFTVEGIYTKYGIWYIVFCWHVALFRE